MWISKISSDNDLLIFGTKLDVKYKFQVEKTRV